MLILPVAIARIYKPSARPFDEVAALVDFLAAQVCRFDDAFQLSPVVGRELMPVLVDFGRYAETRFGVEEDEVCVRACDEVQGAFALTATGRGFEANITAGLDAGFEDSTCVACGACADTCPTDAITEISLVRQSERERS